LIRRSIATGICLSRRSIPWRRSPARFNISRAARTRVTKELVTGSLQHPAFRLVLPHDVIVHYASKVGRFYLAQSGQVARFFLSPEVQGLYTTLTATL
jgi:hypothetical protein